MAIVRLSKSLFAKEKSVIANPEVDNPPISDVKPVDPVNESNIGIIDDSRLVDDKDVELNMPNPDLDASNQDEDVFNNDDVPDLDVEFIDDKKPNKPVDDQDLDDSFEKIEASKSENTKKSQKNTSEENEYIVYAEDYLERIKQVDLPFFTDNGKKSKDIIYKNKDPKVKDKTLFTYYAYGSSLTLEKTPMFGVAAPVIPTDDVLIVMLLEASKVFPQPLLLDGIDADTVKRAQEIAKAMDIEVSVRPVLGQSLVIKSYTPRSSGPNV